MSKHEIISLFGFPVAASEETYVLSPIENKFLLNQETCPNFGKNFTSTDTWILNKKPLKKLKNFFQKEIESYAYGILEIDPTIKFYITQSWVNYNPPKSGHHSHKHPNSILSGVFYIQGEDISINFGRTLELLYLGLRYKHYNIFNSTAFEIGVKKHKLVLFPSTLNHSVKPNTSTTTRVSLSFNTFVTGELGTEFGPQSARRSNLDYLKLK